MLGPINVSDVRRQHSKFLHSAGEIIDHAAHEAAEFGSKYQGHHWKQPTGNLERQTQARVIKTRQGNRIVLSNKAPYALAQEYGSGLHASRGARAKYPIPGPNNKSGKTLRWVSNGRVHFSKRVMHPGVRATRFLFLKTEAAAARQYNILRGRLDALVARS